MTKTSSIDLVIADTSPLIAIAIMDLFPVLKQLFERVLVPDAARGTEGKRGRQKHNSFGTLIPSRGTEVNAKSLTGIFAPFY